MKERRNERTDGRTEERTGKRNKVKAVVSPESQLKGREERSGAELLAELTVRTEDGWSGKGREGRDGRMEGRKEEGEGAPAD